VSVKAFRRYTNLAVSCICCIEGHYLAQPGNLDDRTTPTTWRNTSASGRPRPCSPFAFETTETYHHGACFRMARMACASSLIKDRLLKVWSGDQSVQTRAVAYKEIQQIRDQAAMHWKTCPSSSVFPIGTKRNSGDFRERGRCART